MCKKLTYLISFVLVLGMVLTSAAKADLLAHWKFDEGAGTRIEDSSSNGHHGTVAGTPTWVLGPEGFGGALDFTATVGANCGVFDPTGGTGTFTVTFWSRWDGSPGIQHFITKSNGWNISTMMFQVECKGSGFSDPARDSRLHLACHSFTQAVMHVIPTNEWAHTALVFDGTNATGYLNGVDETGPQPTGIGAYVDAPILIGVAQPLNRVFQGLLDDMQLYSSALSQAEIQAIMLGVPPGAASNPSPADEATDVPREVVLSWTPGEYAPPVNGHKVYLGENFNDVNDGVGGIAQDANSYTPPQRLDFDTTYYWRVDEVNGAPDYAVHEGNVWSFTTEPFGYPIENITATASSSSVSKGPENTINGSGLDDSGLLHGKDGDDNMWLSDIAGPQPTWIEFQFDEVYKLHQLWVWNSNEFLEPMIGFGFKDVTIEYSVNGTNYTALGTTAEFARAPGTPDYAHNTTVDFGGVGAKHVRLTANSNWGGILNQYGLSEVRFFYVPVYAREPSPDSGAADVSIGTIDEPIDVTLDWKAGREAAKHDVYLSIDQQAVLDGTAAATTMTETSYGPLSLDLGKTYYWRVDEVNEAETPATWQGKLWNFTTQEYFVVDDIESYNDLDPGDPNSNRIFLTWIDGYDIPTNGSLVGYDVPPFTEQTIVHGGEQSMPFFFSNTGGAAYSEAELTLTPAQNWTKHGVKTLSLWFSGAASNTAAQMYVKVNGFKVTYDGDASNLTAAAWQPWNIELTSFGAGLQNVTRLAIGIDGNGATGTLLFDDIRLYPYDRQLVTPAEPSNVGLVGHYKLDQDATDSSGNNNHGTLAGNLQWAPGKIDGALSVDGTTGIADHVEISTAGISVSAGTVAMWAKLAPDPQGPATRYFFGHTTIPAYGNRIQLYMDDSDTTLDMGLGDDHNRHKDIAALATEIWYHIALTWDGSNYVVYVNGAAAANGSYTGLDTLNTVADIGNDGNTDGRTEAFNGLLDDVRIYDRVLPQEGIRWLAGKTKPIDKPF